MVACVAALRNCAAPAWPPPARSCWISTPPPIPPMASRSSASTTALMIVASIIPCSSSSGTPDTCWRRICAAAKWAARAVAWRYCGAWCAGCSGSFRACPSAWWAMPALPFPHCTNFASAGKSNTASASAPSCLSTAQPGAGGKSPAPLLAPRPAARSLQQLPASQQALAAALAPHLHQSRARLRRQHPALCHHQPPGHRRRSFRLLSAPGRVRKPHRGTEERIRRRPLELSTFSGQRLSSAAACHGLQSGGAVSAPPALVAAPGANPDLAGTPVQTGSADHPLGAPGGGALRQRLAFSTALAERLPGGGQRLKRFC